MICSIRDDRNGVEDTLATGRFIGSSSILKPSANLLKFQTDWNSNRTVSCLPNAANKHQTCKDSSTILAINSNKYSRVFSVGVRQSDNKPEHHNRCRCCRRLSHRCATKTVANIYQPGWKPILQSNDGVWLSLLGRRRSKQCPKPFFN